MKIDLIYRVENFSPPLETGKTGGYGFNVHLDRDFAIQTRQKAIGTTIQERLNELATENIVRRLFSSKLFQRSYTFLDDKLLVTSFNVPGENDCCLGLAYSEVESLDRKDAMNNTIKFHTHNVDNYQQAYGLFSLFTNWIEYAETWLRPKT